MATNVRKIDNLDVPFKEFMPGQIIQSGQFNDDMKDIEDKVNEIIGEQNTLVDEVNAHIDNFENPHQVTAHQTGTYTSQEIDEFVEDIKSGNLHDNAIGNRVLDDACVSTRNILDGSITSSKLDGSVGSQIDISTNVSIKDRYTKEETDAIIQEKVGSGTYDKATIDEKLEQIQAGQILDKSISIHQLKDDIGRRLDISNNPDIINKYTREEVDLLIQNNALPRDWGSILEEDNDTPVIIPTKETTLPVANHMKVNTCTVSESSILDIDIQENVDARGEFNTVGERLDKIDERLSYFVTPEMFGARGDAGLWCGYKDNIDESVSISGTDDTEAFRKAIQYCIDNNKELVLDGSKRYLITDTIETHGKFSIEGNYAVIQSNIIDKTKPLFLLHNNDSQIFRRIRLLGNGLCKSAIEFGDGDSQMMTLENLDISFFRYGITSELEETVNRVVLNRCEINNCYLGGIRLIQGSGQSTPFRMNDTIIHGNLIHNYEKNGYSNGIKCISDGEHNGQVSQVYLKGVGGITIVGGQITAHHEIPCAHLIYLDGGSHLCFNGVDLEQFILADENGDVENPDNYINYIGVADKGGAIYIKNAKSPSLNVNGSFRFKCDTFVKLDNVNGEATINNFWTDESLYGIDVINSNYNFIPSGGGSYILRLDTNMPLNKLTPQALMSVDKNKLTCLSSCEYIYPYQNTDYIFDGNANCSEGRYFLFGDKSGRFNENPTIKKKCKNPSFLLCLLQMPLDTSVDVGVGRFFVQWLNKYQEVIETSIINPGNYIKRNVNGVGLRYFVVKNPSIETTYVKYGFCLEGSGYSKLDDPGILKVEGFHIYTWNESPLEDFLTSDNYINIDERKYSFSNNFLSFGESQITYGYRKKGEIQFNSNPGSGKPLGWVCIESGSPGVWVALPNIP